MRYFSGVCHGCNVNFCQVFAFSSVLLQSADRQDSAFCRILVQCSNASKNADGMTDIEDPDQTAPLGAV